MTRAQPRIIGAALRRARTLKGLTQAELGELAEVAPETLSRIERNKLSASLDLARRLAQALGVTVDDLLKKPSASKKGPDLRPAEARLVALVRDLDEPQVHEVVRAVKTLMDMGKHRV